MKKIFSGKNIQLLIVSCVVIILGYIFLAQGPVNNPLSLTWAPIMLLLGYCVLVPVAIIMKEKKNPKEKK